jgi:hypothetical protein
MKYILLSATNNFYINSDNQARIIPDFFFLKISEYTPLMFDTEEVAARVATQLNGILKTREKIADIKPLRIV